MTNNGRAPWQQQIRTYSSSNYAQKFDRSLTTPRYYDRPYDFSRSYGGYQRPSTSSAYRPAPPATARTLSRGSFREPSREPSYAGDDIIDRGITLDRYPVDDMGRRAMMPPGQQKFIRQVEVPYQRDVKVPVTTAEIVPTLARRKLPVKRLREVPDFEVAEETYTDYVEEEAVRPKEIWVKQVVEEKYMRKVPVQRTRQVQVPVTRIEEYDDYQEVEVAADDLREVDGFRVDRVEDPRVVEVEEFEEVAWRPEPTGHIRRGAVRDLGPSTRGGHMSRQLGDTIYRSSDPRVRAVDHDEAPNTGYRTSRYY